MNANGQFDEKKGFVLLYRKLIDSHIFHNEKVLKIFIFCMLSASHREHQIQINRQTLTLKPGQFIFGRRAAGIQLNMSESTVWSYMKLLEKSKTINIKSNNKFSLVTIDNWRLYQSETKKTNSKPNNRRTTNEQQTDTNNNGRNVNNDNTRAENILPFESENFKKVWNKWTDYRRQIKKPLKELTVREQLKELGKYPEQTAIAMLEQSIKNSWTGIFDIKKREQHGRPEPNKYHNGNTPGDYSKTTF